MILSSNFVFKKIFFYMNISRYHEYFACPIHNDSNKIHNPIQMELFANYSDSYMPDWNEPIGKKLEKQQSVPFGHVLR